MVTIHGTAQPSQGSDQVAVFSEFCSNCSSRILLPLHRDNRGGRGSHLLSYWDETSQGPNKGNQSTLFVFRVMQACSSKDKKRKTTKSQDQNWTVKEFWLEIWDPGPSLYLTCICQIAREKAAGLVRAKEKGVGFVDTLYSLMLLETHTSQSCAKNALSLSNSMRMPLKNNNKGTAGQKKQQRPYGWFGILAYDSQKGHSDWKMTSGSRFRSVFLPFGLRDLCLTQSST